MSPLKGIQWFQTYKFWNTVLNCSHWLGSRLPQLHQHSLCLPVWKPGHKQYGIMIMYQWFEKHFILLTGLVHDIPAAASEQKPFFLPIYLLKCVFQFHQFLQKCSTIISSNTCYHHSYAFNCSFSGSLLLTRSFVASLQHPVTNWHIPWQKML